VLIRKDEAMGDINGVKICNNALIIYHLLFVDDCFLFFIVDVDLSNKLRVILSAYERASDQVVNLQKSEIFCSRNVSTRDHSNIANILGVHVVLTISKYLGLLYMIGRCKKTTFSFIKDRMWKEINSWNSKSL